MTPRLAGLGARDGEAALLWLLRQRPDLVRESGLGAYWPGEAEQDVPAPPAGLRAAFLDAAGRARARSRILTNAELDVFRALRPVLSSVAAMPLALGAAPASYFAWHVLWRELAEQQKALYRERLLARARPAPVVPGVPPALRLVAPTPFDFDDGDWQNPFQLEAVIEFYLNFNDPWRPSPPQLVGQNVPRLPPPPNASNGYESVDLTTGWHLVVVDAFGGRLNGASARAAHGVLTLDGPPDLAKVNPGFDTIYLPDATGPRTFRIIAVDNGGHTVTVDGAPQLPAAGSRWHIPAGVSGTLPPLAYDLGPGGARGFDHFDGLLLLVKDGTVHARFRWNSYTSRNYAAGSQLLSSIRGNKRYDFETYRSANAFRNYSIKIADPGARYDGVREARFYFATPVTADSAPAGSDPNGGGKTLIRIHHSGTNAPTRGCSSAGCVVSGDYYALRDRMIDLYQADYASTHAGVNDAAVARLRGLDHAGSQAMWNDGSGVTAAQWNGKIRGTFWLVRPDERALG